MSGGIIHTNEHCADIILQAVCVATIPSATHVISARMAICALSMQ